MENEKAEQAATTSQTPLNQPQNTENVTLKPILLEDYKSPEECPKSLQNILAFLESRNAQSRTEILVGLIYLLMIECGFIPNTYVSDITTFGFDIRRVLALSNYVPATVGDNRKSYSLRLNLPHLEQYEVNVLIVCASDDVVVNCFVRGIEKRTCNLLLDPLTYFASSNTTFSKLRFQRLRQFSLTVKNNIAFPVKYSILKQNGIPFACMEDLPSEVILVIMRKMRSSSLVKFSNTNRRFKLLSQQVLKRAGKKMQ